MLATARDVSRRLATTAGQSATEVGWPVFLPLYRPFAAFTPGTPEGTTAMNTSAQPPIASPLAPGPTTDAADRPPLTAEAMEATLHAAHYAALTYEGPIGEIISRELRGYAESGVQLPPSAMGPRLVAAVQRQEARQPLPPAPSWAHLPAQYVPGSPLRWRYRTVADLDQPATDTQRHLG